MLSQVKTVPSLFDDDRGIDDPISNVIHANLIKIVNVTSEMRAFFAQNSKFIPGRRQAAQLRNDAIFFLAGSGSCNMVCEHGAPGSVCARDWFPYLNNSDALVSAFADQKCADLFTDARPLWRIAAWDLPPCTVIPAEGEMLLCPCVRSQLATPSTLSSGTGKATLQLVMKRRMEDLHRASYNQSDRAGVLLPGDVAARKVSASLVEEVVVCIPAALLLKFATDEGRERPEG